MNTKEEILDKHFSMKDREIEKWKVLAAMEEYAAQFKDSPYQGSAGVWRSDRVPDLADGKKAIPHYVKVKKQTHDGKEYVSKRVAYYFPDRFKSVEFEDWDDYDQEDFPYTTEDEEKGVVWLNAGWYESVNCDRCDEYWSAPLEVLEYLDDSATSPAGDGWVSVEEQMPEHNIGVLVFIPDEDDHITSGMWDIEDKWVLLDEYRVPECEVTHWRPLPSPPKTSV